MEKEQKNGNSSLMLKEDLFVLNHCYLLKITFFPLRSMHKMLLYYTVLNKGPQPFCSVNTFGMLRQGGDPTPKWLLWETQAHMAT